MRAQVWRMGLVAVGVVALAGTAPAQVTTERSASILVFPRVIADGTRETIIQISNTSNSMVHAHCFYVNGALTFPDLPAGPLNPPLWTEIDFDIWLTKQQPTHWVVSQGRLVDPTDPPCSNNPPFFGCNDAGTDPGRVPPVVEDFTGELKCIEVDEVGAPVSGNHLKGEATTVTLNNCFLLDGFGGFCFNDNKACASNSDCADAFDTSKYNALGILGNENNNGDNVLCLGGEVSDQCPLGAEYDACPQFWTADHFAAFAPDPVSGGDVQTGWTIVPCTENFETQNPETVTIFLETWNEFEQAFSSFANVTCWDVFSLQSAGETFQYDTLGTTFAQTRLRPTSQTRSGFLMVGLEIHTTQSFFESYAENNLHVEGARLGGDLITIPPDQVAE